MTLRIVACNRSKSIRNGMLRDCTWIPDMGTNLRANENEDATSDRIRVSRPGLLSVDHSFNGEMSNSHASVKRSSNIVRLYNYEKFFLLYLYILVKFYPLVFNFFHLNFSRIRKLLAALNRSGILVSEREGFILLKMNASTRNTIEFTWLQRVTDERQMVRHRRKSETLVISVALWFSRRRRVSRSDTLKFMERHTWKSFSSRNPGADEKKKKTNCDSLYALSQNAR